MLNIDAKSGICNKISNAFNKIFFFHLWNYSEFYKIFPFDLWKYKKGSLFNQGLGKPVIWYNAQSVNIPSLVLHVFLTW